MNLECNHATLCGHKYLSVLTTLLVYFFQLTFSNSSFNFNLIFSYNCHHKLEIACIDGMLGSVDANTGDAQTDLTIKPFTIVVLYYV